MDRPRKYRSQMKLLREDKNWQKKNYGQYKSYTHQELSNIRFYLVIQYFSKWRVVSPSLSLDGF